MATTSAAAIMIIVVHSRTISAAAIKDAVRPIPTVTAVKDAHAIRDIQRAERTETQVIQCFFYVAQKNKSIKIS